MNYYSLGCEIHTTESFSKIAVAENEETANTIVAALNAAQQSVQRTASHVAVDCDCVEFMRSGVHDARCKSRRR